MRGLRRIQTTNSLLVGVQLRGKALDASFFVRRTITTVRYKVAKTELSGSPTRMKAAQ